MSEEKIQNVQTEQELDELTAALLAPTIDVNSDEKIIVNAEDQVYGSDGIKFEDHFFEPQPGSSYLIKILPNPGAPKEQQIGLRSLYRSLPDPLRKGKTFQYISCAGVSGGPKCKVLNAFFELRNKVEKEGSAIAQSKLDKYLKRSSQGCVKVQILSSPKKEEIGNIRLFTFSNAGPNATISHLINKKLNPSAEQLQQGFEKEDIFNVFGSSVLSIVCKESIYDGIKGREYSGSDWSPKKRGAVLVREDGTTYEFSSKDLDEKGTPKKESISLVREFVKILTHPDYDMFNWFLPKYPGHEKNDEKTDTYITEVFKKVDEIIPIILEKSLQEIAAYGKVEEGTTGTSESKPSKDIFKESIPDELKGSIQNNTEPEKSSTTKKNEKPVVAAAEGNDDIDDILNS
jgi:hypothetical protein